MPFEVGSLSFLGTLIRSKLLLRLSLLACSSISQTELAVGFAKVRVYSNGLLVTANGLVEIASREMQNSQLKVGLVELGIDSHGFREQRFGRVSAVWS